MEIHGEEEEACDDAELDDQGCFEEIAPGVSLALGKVGVRAV